ncbi:MAG: TonB-dependent receptor [Pseudomonadales bacterium]
MSESRDSLLRVALIGSLALTPVVAPAALAEEGAKSIEEVVVVGSRRAGRTATDAPVPVDVVNGEDFENMGTSDMDDMLRNLIPSYNVQRFSISDAATITRPATLRGLPPDNTLVLVNGKRMHRSGVIAELGGSLAAGSQGPDVSVIPPVALDRVEVLRDGAAAQYGSDAIAGVINYVLKENREGLTMEAKWGETFEGDGDAWTFAGNAGLPLGDDGFASVSLQYKNADPTDRSLQRTDAQALFDTGNSQIENPAQVWGSPELDDDWAFFINAGIDLADNQELYGFGNYAQRAVTGGFFYRNPNDRSGVFTDGAYRSVIDLSDAAIAAGATGGYTSNCPALLSPGGTPTDQAVVDADRAALAALPSNCWVANNLYPGGYTPAFGGDVEDISGVLGLRGTLESGLGYDVSMGLGRNEVSFRIANTWNPSLGPASPTKFDLGKYVQTEQNYNADFTYPIAVDAFYSDLNVAFGAEYRVETFEIRQGEEASWVAGDYAFQGGPGPCPANCNYYSDGVTRMAGMTIGAHGFPGFGPSQVGEWDRGNYAIYTDLEADVTERWLVNVALRFEDFEDFGETTNWKIATRYNLTDTLSARASYSTGFRAPTPGQSNVTKVSTVTVDGVLQQRGQIPPTNPIAQYLGAEPLDAENATNFTLGFGWDITDDLTVTVDYYEINVKDRISQTGTIDITQEGPIPDCTFTFGLPDGDPNKNLSRCLEELGVPGASDLTSVSFYTNDFETTTKGIDLVATYSHEWGDAGITNFTAAWNWNQTEVDDAGSEVSRNRLSDLENYNPENRGIFTINHLVGDLRLMVRASFYDDWIEGSYSGDPAFVAGTTKYNTDCNFDNCYDGAWIFDAEASYTFNDTYTFIVGAQNFTDDFGPKDKDNTATGGLSNSSGSRYETGTPWGYDGGFYYFRIRAELD